LNITVHKYVIGKADFALVSRIHEYRTGTVNERVMIENYSLELPHRRINHEFVDMALSIDVGTIFNKQRVLIVKRNEDTAIPPT